MKKTIAAILVTILASAGYVVLDKAAVEKIDTLASQVSSQQAVINRLETISIPATIPPGTTSKNPADPLEMHTGSTLRCYPNEGTVVQAYVLDLSRISDDTTATALLTTTTTTTTTTAAAEETTPTTAASTTEAPLTTTTTSPIIFAQQGEPTATVVTTAKAVSTTKAPSTTKAKTTTTSVEEPVTPPTIPPTTYPFFRSPDYYFDTNRYYYYPTQTDVNIQRFRCMMNGKTMTGVPVFVVELSGKVDPAYAGRQIVIWFGDSHVDVERASATIQSDGSFRVSSELTLANSAVIPLSQIRID